MSATSVAAQTNLIAQLSGVSGVKFVSFTYTSKGTGETSRYVFNIGASFTRAYEKDAEFVRGRLESLRKTPGVDPVEIKATEEVLASLEKSLEVGVGNNPNYTAKDTYIQTNIPGVKIHKGTSALHVNGFLVSKTVLEKGVYKVVNSRPKTIFKNKLRKMLRTGKIRQFRLPNVGSARINGDTIEFS